MLAKVQLSSQKNDVGSVGKLALLDLLLLCFVTNSRTVVRYARVISFKKMLRIMMKTWCRIMMREFCENNISRTNVGRWEGSISKVSHAAKDVVLHYYISYRK